MKKLSIILGTLFIIILLITGLSINLSWVNKSKEENINVTGSAKRDFTSDIIVWSATYHNKNMSLKEAYKDLDRDRDVIKTYLLEQNIPTEDILFTSISMTEKYKTAVDKDGVRTHDFDGYYLSQNITIESKLVEKIELLSRNITNLIDLGVEIQSNQPYYFYSKLEDLKIDLISEATENATLRAVKIAEKSNSHFGKVKKAQMGVFQIIAKNSTENYTWGGAHNKTSKKKTASVTMKLSFEIKD